MTESGSIQFFSKYYLGDFEMVDMLWNNQDGRDNYSMIEDKFHLSRGTGESVVKYINYLYNSLVTKENDRTFSWILTTHTHVENMVAKHRSLFLVELYARAFQAMFMKDKATTGTCDDYFAGDLSTLAKVCK
jgi:hypothetical protein